MPQGIQIGPFMLRFYGILIVLGAVLATWLASKLIRSKAGVLPGFKAPQMKEDEGEEAYAARVDEALGKDADRLSEMAWDLMPWALLGGLIGARLWHVFLPAASQIAAGLTTQYYLTHPLDAIAVWRGGLGIPGAVIGGFIAVLIYCRTKNMPMGYWADAVAPGLALAQAIGRWGNFFNQEVYGSPTSLPWKIFIEPAYRLAGYQNVEYYHPLFLYESLWNLANMGFLIWLYRRQEDGGRPWSVFFGWMVVYGVGRFLLEFLRLDPAPLGTFNGNQWIMLGVAVAGAGLLAWNLTRKSADPVSTEA